MKTPKQILLEEHQKMEARLMRMSEDVLAAELGRPTRAKKISLATVPLTLWNELIWPSRKTWAGLAAVWVALAIFHFSQNRQEGSAKGPEPLDGQVMAAWAEQEKMLTQFVNNHMQAQEKNAVSPPPPMPAKSAEWLGEEKTAVA